MTVMKPTCQNDLPKLKGQVVLKTDVRDPHGDVFPKDTVQKAIDYFIEHHLIREFITADFDPSVVVGMADRVYLDGNEVKVDVSLLHIAMSPEEVKRHIAAGRAHFVLEGRIHKASLTEEGRTIEAFDMTKVSFSTRSLQKKEGESGAG